jgi:hypothetical protein
MGRAHLANSLLLSRLWHVLRVIVVPKRWPKKCESLIRQFVCPYNPAPSWSSITKHKANGGAGVINISQQALALHFTFLQNALRDGKWHFTSSLISSILRAHTSQPSLVSLLLFPRQMERMLLAIPQMAQLCKLISSLRMMRVSPSWPTHLLTMLPARSLLLKPLQVPSNRNLDLSLKTPS